MKPWPVLGVEALHRGGAGGQTVRIPVYKPRAGGWDTRTRLTMASRGMDLLAAAAAQVAAPEPSDREEERARAKAPITMALAGSKDGRLAFRRKMALVLMFHPGSEKVRELMQDVWEVDDVFQLDMRGLTEQTHLNFVIYNMAKRTDIVLTVRVNGGVQTPGTSRPSIVCSQCAIDAPGKGTRGARASSMEFLQYWLQFSEKSLPADTEHTIEATLRVRDAAQKTLVEVEIPPLKITLPVYRHN